MSHIYAHIFICTLILLTLPCHLSASSSSSPSSSSTSSSSNDTCRPFSSSFDFARAAPHEARDLSFCKEYRHSTCCTHAHTTTILRFLSPLFLPAAASSDACRQMSSSLLCAPCHPSVGTGMMPGVCDGSCDALLSACATTMFDDAAAPCTENSLVCAKLNDIVQSGREFCERIGLVVVSNSSPSSSPSPSSSSSSSLSPPSSLREFQQSVSSLSASPASCFDGSGSTETPRHYRPKSDVEEMERKRRERDEARERDERDKQSIISLILRALQPLSVAYRRAVRRLPAAIRNYIESPFAFVVPLAFIALFIWAPWRRKSSVDVRARRADALMRNYAAASSASSASSASAAAAAAAASAGGYGSGATTTVSMSKHEERTVTVDERGYSAISLTALSTTTLMPDWTRESTTTTTTTTRTTLSVEDDLEGQRDLDLNQ